LVIQVDIVGRRGATGGSSHERPTPSAERNLCWRSRLLYRPQLCFLCTVYAL